MAASDQRPARPAGVKHWVALDGVRGLAVLCVVVYHLRIGLFARGGWIGVEVFFVLSGFLITSLLLNEHDRDGAIDVGNFARRRARRLLPALGIFLVATLPYEALLANARERSSALLAFVSSASYTTNWVKALDRAQFGVWNHTWSLAIEVQFYLLWTVVLLAVLRSLGRNRVLAVVTVLALGATAWRIVIYLLGAPQVWLYNATDVRIASLLIGAWLAVVRLDRPRWVVPSPAVRAGGAIGLVGLTVAASLLVNGRAAVAFGLIPVGLAAVALVTYAVAAEAGRLHTILSWAPLRLLGRVSYGLYLWHKAVIKMFDEHPAGRPRGVTVVLEVAVFSLLTAASWQVEKRVRLAGVPWRRRASAGVTPPVS